MNKDTQRAELIERLKQHAPWIGGEVENLMLKAAELLADDKATINEAELWEAFDHDPKAALAMAIRGLHRLADDKARPG